MTATYHARRDDAGRRVLIRHPSTPTPPATWSDPAAMAVFVPDGPVPPILNGISMAPWSPPEAAGAWEKLASGVVLDEPAFVCPAGLKPAAGVVLIEPDLRVFLAQPSNGFGGVAHVVPKGRIDTGGTPAASALREAWEEVGLLGELTGHLLDVARSTTFVRYYVGRRAAGSPECMQWESQAAVLCPPQLLSELLNGPHDRPLVGAVLRYLNGRR